MSKGGATTNNKNFAEEKTEMFYCKKPRQMIKDCRAQIATEVATIKQNNIAIQCNRLYVTALVVKPVGNLDPTWYVDMGATQHMSYDRNFFISYEEWERSQVVYLGDDTTHKIYGQEKLIIQLGDGKIKELPNVLYILGLIKIYFLSKKWI